MGYKSQILKPQRSGARTGGPAMRLPSVSYEPPWHGQMKPPAGIVGISVTWLSFSFSVWLFASSIGPPGWTGQPAYERVFGAGWRIIAASMCAFFAGDFLNSVVLAKMKVLTKGKYLWTRTIGSTVIGEGADSLIFYPLAFYGMADWPVGILGAVMLSQFVLKVGWEVVLTPVTYLVVGWLKRKAGVAVYDVGTDFTPFQLDV